MSDWKGKPEYKEYKRLDFVKTMYYLNDHAIILNAGDPYHNFIAKILKIIKIE